MLDAYIHSETSFHNTTEHLVFTDGAGESFIIADEYVVWSIGWYRRTGSWQTFLAFPWIMGHIYSQMETTLA